MQQRLAKNSFLLKLSGISYSIQEQPTYWRQFPLDEQSLQYLDRNNIKEHDWIQGLSVWMASAVVLTMKFTRQSTYIIMGIFFLTVIGITVAAFLDIDWLGVALMIIGIVGLVVYTAFAIIKFKKKVNEIRQSLTLRINSSERDHHVRVDEIYLNGCPCCQPVLPAMLNIYRNAE